MAWKKVPPELVEFMDHAMAPLPCHRKIMFGCPAYFVNNNMFAGLHEDHLFVRLSERDRAAILGAVPGAAVFEPMPGQPMREYVVLPPELYHDEEAFDRWLDRALQYALSLPAKAPRPRKPRKAAQQD